MLTEIRKEFKHCSTSSQVAGKGANSRRTAPQAIHTETLAIRWLQLVEADRARRGLGPPGALDEQAVALRVAQLLRELDITSRGSLREEDWIHGIHLLTSDRLAEQTMPLLRMALVSRPRTLTELQSLFEHADVSGSGRLSFKQIAELYNSGIFRVSPKSKDGHQLTEAEVRTTGPERLARELVEAMDVDGDAHVSYAEFLAYCVGRRKSPVYLYMYDLSKGLATLLSPWVLGPGLDNIWHSGVVVYGKEYFFAKDAVWDFPGKTDFGVPTKEVFLGYTFWSKSEFHGFICNELKPVFHRDTYDAIGNNCNHFADRLSLWLTGRRLPDAVLLQTERLMKMSAVRAFRPALNRALRDHVAARGTTSEEPPGGGAGAAGGPSGPGQETTLCRMRRGLRRPIEPDEVVAIGTVVSVQPHWGRGAGILGMVCEQPVSELINARGMAKFGPDCASCALPAFGYCCRPTEVSRHDGETDLDIERDPSLIWVRYFDLAPPACVGAGWSGRIRLEGLPRERVLRVAPEDSTDLPAYLSAVSAIASAQHTSHRASLPQHFDDEALLSPTARLNLPRKASPLPLKMGSPNTTLLPGPRASRGSAGIAVYGLEAMRPRSLREPEEASPESISGWSRADLEDDSVRLL